MSRANPRTTHGNAGIASWRFKLKAEVHSYEDAAQFLRDTEPRWRLVGDVEHGVEHGTFDLGPHMVVVEQRDYLAVMLYDTEIIRYYPDGTFSVDNGGHSTPTTMYRLNAVLPDGWVANHHKKQLALRRVDGDWLEFWPCTHDRRITP